MQIFGAVLCAVILMVEAASAQAAPAGQVARGEVFKPVELSFRGPQLGPRDAPARDVEFWVRFQSSLQVEIQNRPLS